MSGETLCEAEAKKTKSPSRVRLEACPGKRTCRAHVCLASRERIVLIKLHLLNIKECLKQPCVKQKLKQMKEERRKKNEERRKNKEEHEDDECQSIVGLPLADIRSVACHVSLR